MAQHGSSVRANVATPSRHRLAVASLDSFDNQSHQSRASQSAPKTIRPANALWLCCIHLWSEPREPGGKTAHQCSTWAMLYCRDSSLTTLVTAPLGNTSSIQTESPAGVVGRGGAFAVALPARSQVARPASRANDIPFSVAPSNPTALAGTSRRTHVLAFGIGPI